VKRITSLQWRSLVSRAAPLVIVLMAASAKWRSWPDAWTRKEAPGWSSVGWHTGWPGWPLWPSPSARAGAA